MTSGRAGVEGGSARVCGIGLGELTGAEKDVAGGCLDFGGGGYGGQSRFRCDKSGGQVIACELSPDEARVRSG